LRPQSSRAELGRDRTGRRGDRRACRGRSVELDVEGRGLGHVADGQVAGHAIAVAAGGLDGGRGEGDGREALDVEEVGGAQVRVAGAEVRVDAGGRDR
jgi:hypothetical protein